jgi:hypothetical protein
MQARQLNPAETSQFIADMGTLPDEHRADVALKWRERCINALTTYVPSPAREVLQFGATGVFTGLLGAWDGRNDADRSALVQNWLTEAGPKLGIDVAKHPTPFRDVVDPSTGATLHKAVADPRNMWGANKALYPTLGLALTSIGLSWADKGQSVNPFLKAGALGGGGYLVGSAMRDLFYSRRVAQLESAAAPLASGNGAEGGAAENPCGGYPRAVA